MLKSKQRPKKRKRYLLTGILIVTVAIVFLAPRALAWLGHWLVASNLPPEADAAVVLESGTEVFPRLIQAAALYNKGIVRNIVINGNRKTDVMRALERQGYQPGCAWYEDHIRVLLLKGVPRNAILTVSAEDAFDTISEARVVGAFLVGQNLKRIIVTTSKFHTRRARHIWRHIWGDKLQIYASPATQDPYAPDGWWREGRQIRWVLAEYGAWLYYAYNRLLGDAK